MAKGQKKSSREAKKPKKAADKSNGAGSTALTGLTAFGGKASGTSYKDRYAKKT